MCVCVPFSAYVRMDRYLELLWIVEHAEQEAGKRKLQACSGGRGSCCRVSDRIGGRLVILYYETCTIRAVGAGWRLTYMTNRLLLFVQPGSIQVRQRGSSKKKKERKNP